MAFKNDFRPDIIAGNPPYNNGMDIDFVFDAYEVSRIAVSEITPAKFQSADADQNIDSNHSYGDFRRNIVPHIKELVFYPQSINVFDIYQIDGIAFYIINTKILFERTHIINRCVEQLSFNNDEVRSIKDGESLNNIGNTLCSKLVGYEKFTFSYSKFYRFQVWTNTQVSGSGSRFMSNDGTATVIGVSRIIDSSNNEISTSTASECVFSSDNIESCKSFISWINTKLVRFLVGINTSKLTGILTDNTFRFVPKPKDFNHIYTDKEMYETYNIMEFADIIEKVMGDKKYD